MTTYRDKTTDQRIEVDDASADPIVFFPQGGGFQCRMPREEFERNYEVAPAPVFRPATVTADFLEGEDGEPVHLACYSNGDRWNGWGMPYLTRSSVDRLTELHPGVFWAGNGEDVIVKDDDAGAGYYEVSPHVMPDGVLAWPVGAGNWCWNDCTCLDDKVQS